MTPRPDTLGAMTVRLLPDPNMETPAEPKDRCGDSGNVIQIICPGCMQANVLDPRRVERLRKTFGLRCAECAALVEVRSGATRPVPDDIASLYTTEPIDARPAGWKRLLGSRH
jgi:hypothetical protein